MICVSIAEYDLNACLEAVESEEMAEIRIDLCKLEIKDIEILFSHKTKLIATCRPGKHTEDERTKLLQTAIRCGAAYVDIEIESSPTFKKEIITCARTNGCSLVVSYHNYDFTPGPKELKEIMADCFAAGADIAKIACMVKNPGDLLSLLSLYCEKKKVISIGMGEKGKISRIVATYLGAPFTYASQGKGKETASGQIDRHTLEEIFKLTGGK